MALTDIVVPPGDEASIYFNRGNTGTLVDIQADDEVTVVIPEVTNVSGGNIFIMSE